MGKEGSVSVIIPVYNCGRYLQEAIESVFAQTVPVKEIIVIDDGSTDNSRHVAMNFKDRLKYIYLPHSGSGIARNRGIQAAQGEYLAFLDADDLWMQDKLSRQLAAFEGEPELDMVFGHVQQFHTPELKESLQEKITFAAEVMPGYSCGAMLIKRESFFRVGLFDTECIMGEFIDWHLKARDLGLKSIMLPEIVLKRRLHETNLGVRLRDHRNEYVRIVRASLERRRKKEPA